MEEFIKCDTNSSMILEHIRIRKIIGECNYFESKFFYPFPDKNNIRLNKKLKGGVL